MIKLSFLIVALIAMFFLTGCGEEEAVSYYTDDVATGSVREYDILNEANRVNVFITLGQSNSKGLIKATDSNVSDNIFMPAESVKDYPEDITFIKFKPLGANKAHMNLGNENSATAFANLYNSSIPLYVFNISRGANGIDFKLGASLNNWSVNRVDSDGLSLHPQTIHYIQSVITQLQNEGKEPYVVGMDWNQWETALTKLTVFEYFENYSELFDTIGTVIPNSDYKLFLCNPTSSKLNHRDNVRDAFELIKSDRQNVHIYKPDELAIDDVFISDGIHYTKDVYYKIAEYIKGLI